MRPTSAGWATLAAGVIVYACGVALGYPELVIVGAVLIGLLLAALAWVARAPTLAVHREIEPARVRRGEPALGLVQVKNTGKTRSPRLSVEDRAGEQKVRIEVAPLRPSQNHQSTYRVPSDRRGVFSVGPLLVSQTDPFGLLTRRRDFGEAVTLWVHPRSWPVPNARAGGTVEMDGPMDENAPEGSIAFQGLRPYVIGDDLRMVHWRTSARAGTLMVKKHVDTNRPQVVVILDDRRSSYPAPADAWFEEAVEVTASLIEQAMRNAAPVRLDLVSGALSDYVPIVAVDALDTLAGVTLADGETERVEPGPGVLARVVLSMEQEIGGSAAALVSGDQLSDDLNDLEALGGRYRRVSALLVGSETSGSRQAGRIEVCRSLGASAVVRQWGSGRP